MKTQTLIVVLIILMLSCKKDERIIECPRQDIELKILNRTNVIVGIQSVLLGCSVEANPSGESINYFTVEANQTSDEIISNWGPHTYCFNAANNASPLHPWGCIGYGSPITEETQQIIILITFNGTDYVLEYL